MKKLTLSELEGICSQMNTPYVQELGNNLYKIMPEGIICGESFLKILYEKILQISKEYNTDTSAEHPIKDDDIVRYSNEN